LGEPLQGHQGSVFSVAVSPDDSRIASGGKYGNIIIWDVERKQVVFKLVKHTESVNCVCFSPDGERLASGSNDGTAVIWNTKTGAVLTTLVVEGFWNAVYSVAFSPDGLRLASGTSDGIIHVCHTDNAELLLKFKAHEIAVCGILWSPGGQQLISASHDKTVKFWNSSTGCQIGQPCTGHTDRIRSLAIASDGSFIATASNDKTMRLWSTKTYQQIGQSLEYSSIVECVAMSTGGALLASGGLDGRLCLWSIRNILQMYDMQERYKEVQVEQQPRRFKVVNIHFLLFHHISLA
jgi:WD40 repeat protein